jgi:hypothetical protein
MYCGDHEHYEFLGRAFELFAHVNALQRDICPSMTKFEGEIIAMTLDMLNAPEEAVGLVTSGGSGSILHAVLAYREWAARERGIRMPNFVKPETAHPAFDKACHLLGIECRRAPVDPKTTLADIDAMASLIDENTIGMVGSACNSATAPSTRSTSSASSRSSGASGCTSTGVSVVSSCRGARNSATRTFRCSTSACRASRRSPPTPTSTVTA